MTVDLRKIKTNSWVQYASGEWGAFIGDPDSPIREYANPGPEILQVGPPLNVPYRLLPWWNEVPVLDHGFVQLLDVMGDDQAVVQAARTSYGREMEDPKGMRSLIRYLMRHRHTTPFEMCEIKLRVQMPIFVARQWVRHRMASINEYSARYSPLIDEFYVPGRERLKHGEQSKSNKQGSEASTWTDDESTALMKFMRDEQQSALALYHILADQGMALELARTVTSVGQYTRWVWKTDLHNLLHFLSLRDDPHAQHEIRVYAESIADIVKAWCPIVYEAYEDYRKNAVTLSAQEWAWVRAKLHELRDDLVDEGFKIYHNTLDPSADELPELSARELAAFKTRLSEPV